MNATSTHDTKRSEDVRARIDVLSELAEEWGDRVLRWREWNAPLRPVVEGEPFPDTNTEYLIYQTLLGIWPLESRAESDVQTRLKSYLLKAMREAKTHTDWLRPNLPYEAAVEQFVDALYGAGAQRFREDFHAFQARVAWFGALNSLSQTLLRITAPGVPDMYQGTEVWDFSLVDPDNRRAVDFSLRQRLLDSIPTDPAELLRDWQTGAIKMFVIQQALTFRRAARALFADGEYMPLDVDGAASEHVVAFARRAGTAWAVTVVPRLCACLARQREIADYSAPLGTTVWGDTRVILPPDAPTRWRGVLDAIDVHGDGAVRVADVLGRLPVALLSNDLSRKRQVVARGTSL